MSFKRSVSLGCAGLLSVVLTVGAADTINVYHIPKENPAGSFAGHSADDGHNHGGGGNPHGMRALPKVTYTTPEGWRETRRTDARTPARGATRGRGTSA